MNFKLAFATLSILIFSATTLAQDSSATAKTSTRKNITEFHFAVANINPVNVQIKYKEQIAKKTFFKLGLINMMYSQSHQHSPNGSWVRSSETSLGIEIGLEFRSNLNEAICFYHGPNVSLTNQSSVSRILIPAIVARQESYTLAIPYSLGMLIHLKNHFYFSGEINPGVSYMISRSGTYSEKITVGFTNNFALVALAYRL